MSQTINGVTTYTAADLRAAARGLAAWRVKDSGRWGKKARGRLIDYSLIVRRDGGVSLVARVQVKGQIEERGIAL